MDKDQIDAFHAHLNHQNQHISFTVERYSDSGLPFLDTLNKVLEDGTIDLPLNTLSENSSCQRIIVDTYEPLGARVTVVKRVFD